jgi:hypothetical protein
MRSRLNWGLATLVALLSFGTTVQAQPGVGLGSGGLSDSGGLPGLPGETSIIPFGGGGGVTPLPLGNPGNHGFYTFAEGVYLTQTWTLGNQIVAYRGLVDAQGALTGLPGIYLGSGVPALSTDNFGRRTFAPGLNIGVGYKLEDGPSFFARYMSTAGESYSNAATLVPPFFRSRVDLADTFLVAPVFNFPSNYAGPAQKTGLEGTTSPLTARIVPDNTFYGIWNGASAMTMTYDRHFSEGELGSRTPMFQTEYSRIYGLTGARFNWFFERFRWYTQSLDLDGNGGPQNSATYTNTLSQRMYGPYLGFGHDIYLGNRFALSTDMSAALLLSVVKERAKYKLDDDSIQAKRSRNSFELVPSVGGNINMLWYPLSGVQVRIGYQVNTFWNTTRMRDPVGFDYGAIDPTYTPQAFRLIHGLNFGIGVFF